MPVSQPLNEDVMRPEDSALVRAFRDHDGALRAFLTRLLGSDADAAEVAQETYLKLHRLNAMEQVTHPKAFLFRTAVNLAKDRIKRRKRAVRGAETLDVVTLLPDRAPSAERRVLGRQALELLNQALRELPPRRRQVIVMHKMMDMSHQEIADKLGISRSMVEQHMTRALAHCRKRLRHIVKP